MTYDDEINALVGKNAGQIAMTLDLPYIHPYGSVIDGAIAVQESLRSTWIFAGMDSENNTVWISPDQVWVLHVDSDGDIKQRKL